MGGVFDTPLQAASAKGCLEIVQFPRHNYSDPDLCNGEGTTPWTRRSSEGIIRPRRGCETNEVQGMGVGPLYISRQTMEGWELPAFLLNAVWSLTHAAAIKRPPWTAAGGGNLELV
jgi:hypothetical protein